MGTWGAGNFDDDTAADHLSSVTGRLLTQLREAFAGNPVGLEPDEYDGVAVPCNLELLCLIAKQKYVGVMLPDADTLAAWKTKYLAIWDATIDGLSPGPDYKKARRKVLAKTFDHLIVVVRKRAEPKPKPTKKKAAKPRKR